MIKSGVNTEGEKAGQEFNHVICDVTSIIVDDGVTLHPGFIEIKDGQVIAHFSDDPNNKENPFLMNDKGEATGKNPNFSLGMLTNRVEFRFTQVLDSLEAGIASILEGMHFISMEVMNLFITKLEAKKAEEAEAPVEELVAPEELDTTPEIVDDTVMDEPIVEETTETPTEEVVTEAPIEETAVEEETPEVAEEVEVPTEEVAPIDDTGTVSIEDETTVEPASEDEVEETTPEVEGESEPVATAGAHLIDMGGILRCSVCMLTAGSIGGEEEIANHMAIHDGTAEPAVETEPEGGMMTTENMPA